MFPENPLLFRCAGGQSLLCLEQSGKCDLPFAIIRKKEVSHSPNPAAVIEPSQDGHYLADALACFFLTASPDAQVRAARRVVSIKDWSAPWVKRDDRDYSPEQPTHSNRCCLAAWHHAAIAADVAGRLPLDCSGSLFRRWPERIEPPRPVPSRNSGHRLEPAG